MATGMRVSARWRDERVGDIHDIEAFVPEEWPMSRRPRARHDDRHAHRAPLPVHRRPGAVAVPARRRAGEAARPALPEVQEGLRARPAALRRVRRATEEEVELSDKGTVTTFCVVNVPFYGQQIEIPYVSATILLDGADIGLMHLIQECRGRGRAHGHAGRGGVEAGGGAHAEPGEHQLLPPDRRARRRLRDVPGTTSEMRDVAVVSFAQWSAREEPAATRSRSSCRSSARRSSARASAARRSASPCRAPATTSPACRSRSSRGLDAVGAWPPIRESHVEMDGAWALYEAWVRLQHGDIDSALVYAFGKSSLGDMPTCSACSSTRTTIAPLWPDAVSLGRPAGAGVARRRARRGRHGRGRGPQPQGARRTTRTRQVSGDETAEALLREPYLVDAAARATTARRSPTARPRSCSRPATWPARCASVPAWITGIDHRIEAHALGVRDLTHVAVHARLAGERAGVNGVDVAELHAPFTHQELILRDALGLSERRRRQPVRRRARRQRVMARRPHPHRRGGPADHGRHGGPGARPRHVGPVPAAEPGVRAGGSTA